MIEITAPNDIQRVHALFRAQPVQPPSSLRVYAMLNGDTRCHVYVDDPAQPAWAAVQEVAYDRVVSFAGALRAPVVCDVVERLRCDGDVVLCLWPEFAYLIDGLAPPDYDGEAVDFTERSGSLGPLIAVPDGCALRRVDVDLLRRKSDYEAIVLAYGGEAAALQKGLGFCLVCGDEVVCETFTGPATDGMVELGVETREGQHRRGYATVTCANLIATCERMGLKTFWNAAALNTASIALARKLGYRREQPHRVLAWHWRDGS